MTLRCAILDDYQNAALSLADWPSLAPAVEVTVFNRRFGGIEEAAQALQGFAIVCLMRERTAFSADLIARLPDLKLIATTGPRNAAIDLAAASGRGIVVCGTTGSGNPTAALAIGLMLELTRRIGFEHARLKAGAEWQATLGLDLEGLTLGLLGLGKLGSKVAAIGRALGMQPVAWSQNLTPEKAQAGGADYVGKDELFRRADILSIHLQLSDRTRGLVGAQELKLMRPSAYLVNTARGPIVDEAALIAALRERRLAGAGLDVFDVEPLPLDHPLRDLDNVVLTPHLGYVTRQNYRAFYGGLVEVIRAFAAGTPIRVIA